MKVESFVCWRKYITEEQKSKSFSGTDLYNFPIKNPHLFLQSFSVMLK